MAYVDGFIVAVPRKKLEAYRRMARKAANSWIDPGGSDQPMSQKFTSMHDQT